MVFGVPLRICLRGGLSKKLPFLFLLSKNYSMRLLTLIIIILVLGSKFTYAEFQYSSVGYKLWAGTKYINVTAVFFNVKTDAISEPIPTFTVGIDGNMDRGYFHSIRFDEKSFPIPDEVSSDQDQLGRFFVYHQTIEDGSKVCHLYKLGNTKTQITLKRFG